MVLRTVLAIALSCLLSPEVLAGAEAVQNGAIVKTPGLDVRVQFYGESTVRVLKWLRQGSPAKKSLAVVQDKLPDLKLDRQDSATSLVVASKTLKVTISKQDGSVALQRISGEMVLREAGKAALVSVAFGSDKGYGLEQRFALSASEGIFGLGQHQDGIMNYRGHKVVLVQANTQSAIPFLVSSRGYGMLWDNTSKTVFSD